jgi:hypothetical protein
MTERCVYDLEPYVESVLAARGRGLPVKLGLEVDYVPGREVETRGLLAPYPWDYLLGSVHFLGELSVDGEEFLLADAVGVEEAWRLYFETLAAAARSRLFDSLSHPDLVKIFGHRAASFDYGPVVDAIADSGVAVEVSTPGSQAGPRALSAPRVSGGLPGAGRSCHPRVRRPLARGGRAGLSTGAELPRRGLRTVTVFEQRRGRQELLG